jgi:hypothetical protein
MTAMPAGEAATSVRRAALAALALATAASFVLVVQNFVADILPERTVRLDASRIRPYSAEKTFAYTYPFDGSEPDQWPNMRSRLVFLEDGRPYDVRGRTPAEVTLVGGPRFTHEPGRIVFATTDNTDPLANGRVYSLRTPVLYNDAVGDAALLVLAACVAAWWRVGGGGARARPAPVPVRPAAWRWHLAGAAALFLAGLYCNTGSLAPYAVTSSPYVPADTGYAYNQDHPHFRVLFDFVDGRDRSVWDHALLLRRILFPVLGWPLMKLLGFELGGTLASLALNLAAFVAGLALMRRWVGERAAVLAAWVLALYPGAAYWGGLPYTYALIFPASLLLMVALWRLPEIPAGWRFAAVSLAMGVAYLGYDLAVFFIPATILALAWRRRFATAAASALLQAAPLALWMAILRRVFHQSLENPNSGIYRSAALAFLQAHGLHGWWHSLARIPATGADVFFAANFSYVPALFLAAVVLNPLTARIRLHAAEGALLATTLALFLVLNLPPGGTGGWEMSGDWISRLYQPVFPALVFFTARWWQALPAPSLPLRALAGLAVAAASIADALVVFGPILGDPLGVSGAAFYRFYDHTDAHFLYGANLRALGRRPLGFPRPAPPPPPPPDTAAILRGELLQLANIRTAIAANAEALWQNRRQARENGRLAASVQCDLFNLRLEARRASGEITAEQARRQARTWQDFATPQLKELLADPALDAPGPPGEAGGALPGDLAGVRSALGEDSKRLVALQGALGQAERQLSGEIAQLSHWQAEYNAFKRAGAAPGR